MKTINNLWHQCEDKCSAILAYKTTPLSPGFSPSEMMFGRPTRSKLGLPIDSEVDYEEYEYNKRRAKCKWDRKHSAAKLPKLKPGQDVFIRFLTDEGFNGVVLRRDSTPEGYWVKISSEIRRNGVHLFLLDNSVPGENRKSGIPLWDHVSSVGESVEPRDNENKIVVDEEVEQIADGEGEFQALNDVLENGSDVSEENHDVYVTSVAGDIPSDDLGDMPTVVESGQQRPAVYVTKSGREVRQRRYSYQHYY